MATQVHDGQTRPIVNTDPALPQGHRFENVLVVQGPSGPILVQGTALGEIKVVATVTAQGPEDLPDTSTFTEGTSVFSVVGGTFNDGMAALASGKAGAVRLTDRRALHANLRRADGTEVGTSANPLQVGDAGSTLSVDDGGGSITTDTPDGSNAALGATTDADTANTVIGRLKQLLTRLPAALVSGRLDVNVGNVPSVNQGTSPWVVGDGGSSLSVDDGGAVLSTDSADGAHATLGNTADADTANTVIGRLKKIVALLAGGLPAALVGGRLDVNVGAINATTPATVSTNNSTTATLGASGVFTGTGEEVKDFTAVTLNIEASHAGATDGISVEWSNDNTNWDRAEKFTYRAASLDFSVTFRPKGRYYRVVYTNGGTAQTTFRLQSILHPTAPFEDGEVVSGRVLVDGVSYEVKRVKINATASGDNTIITAVAGRRFRVLTITFLCSASVDVAFKSAATTIVDAMAFAKNGGLGVNQQPAGSIPEGGVNENWIMNLSSATNVRGWLTYAEIP